MECKHLCDCVKLEREVVKSKKNEVLVLSTSVTATTTQSATSVAMSNNSSSRTWKCTDCGSIKDNWMCLNCGYIACGRYDQGHALKHSQKFSGGHDVCLNTNILSVYCYKCDEFVINDTADNTLEAIRNELREDCMNDGSSETSSTLEEVSSTKSSTLSSETTVSTPSSVSSDSGWDEPQRKLRPRKRTTSSDNSENVVKKTKPMKRVVGLRNLGNTCFMNSVLQSLSNIQEFSCYFNTLPAIETNKQKQRYHSRSMKENLDDVFVVEELRKVLLNLSKGGDGTKGAISPECLFLVIWKVVPQFRGHRQHDAHEFLRYMLDRLHTELQQMSAMHDLAAIPSTKDKANGSNNMINFAGLVGKSRTSIVTSVFGGTLQSEVRCLICGMESKKHDPFLDLSLDIPERFYSKDEMDSKPVCHISDCLSSFTEVEELTETELYYCNSCKCKQRSTKRFWIRRLPNVLCLHIKRFRWNNFFRTKIDLRITFPIQALDMSQFVLNNGPETRRSNSSCNIYDLAAVIVHHGNGSSCGHYTSFAINNGVWMHFNDHTVKEVSPNVVADCKPYILFYIKREANNSSSKASSVTTTS